VKFWEGGAPLTLVLLFALLALAATLRRLIPPLDRLKVPDSMVAGVLALALGPGVVGLLPLNQDVLERLVYHGLAILYISVTLQSPARGEGAGTLVKGFAFGIPSMAVMQGLIGLVLVLAWSAVGASLLHPGVGMMIPLGFSQGPGQALAMGAAWEDLGMVDGGQIGLIMAAMGFLWCIVVGIPLVAVGRRMGWLEAPPKSGGEGDDERDAPPAVGGLEPLTRQLAAISAVYLLTWGVLQGASALLAGNEQAQATIFGFHFIIGALLGIAARKGAAALGQGEVLHTPLLARISALSVDLVTVSAIGAVQIAVVRDWWLEVLVFTSMGGLSTLVACLWLSRRAFQRASFEHALVLFGAATGTLATGLALLRMVDPELRGPVPTSAVLGSAAALPLAAPLLAVMQVPGVGWPDSYPGRVWLTLGILVAYVSALVVAWRVVGGLRFLRPLGRIWPDPGAAK
jgi:ESS family glutamate:Na+ symporter